MADDVMAPANPDAGQDADLVRSILQEELGPIFEVVGSRIKDLEEDLGETKDLLYKLCEGLIGAADTHKRTSLSEELSGKYGKDMEPFEGFYKDTMGKGYKDSILEELMGENAPDEAGRDEWMKNRLAGDKGKYGKYLGIKMEAEPAPEAAEEAAAPELEAEESPEKQGEEAIEGEAPKGIYAEMMKLSGGKKKLSEPIAAKKK